MEYSGDLKSPNLRRLKNIVHKHKIVIVGICEPKLSRDEVDSIRIRLNFDSVLCNSSGELWVFFNFPFISHVVGDSDQHLSIR